MTKQPAILIYTGDWLKDPRLSLCTPATRGVWIDLLCAMHEDNRSGELRGTNEQLARVARCSTIDLDQALTDLQTTGAADIQIRNGVVTVTNRRMKRDADMREAARIRQLRRRSKGGRSGVTDMSQQCSTIDVEDENEDALLPSVFHNTELETENFARAWGSWEQHRKEIRKSITPTALKQQAKKLLEIGHDRAIAAIEHSIANGYTGIYEPSHQASGASRPAGERLGRISAKPGKYDNLPGGKRA